jgi:hypothetical protein
MIQQTIVIIVLAAIAYQFRTDVAQAMLSKVYAPSTESPWTPGVEFKSLSWANKLQQTGQTGGCCFPSSWVTVDKVFCSDELSMLDDAIPALAVCTNYVKSRTEWPILSFSSGWYVGNITQTRGANGGQFEIKSLIFNEDEEGYEKRSTKDSIPCKMIAKCRASPSTKDCKALRNSIKWC